MNLQSKENLIENLRDKKFRDSFVVARVDGGTAFQMRYLREGKGWTQTELARLLGTSQNSVWRLESPNYGKASISTLKRIASIFDVALVVRFVRFSELVDQVLNQTTESFTVDSFDKDYKLWEPENPATKPGQRPGKVSPLAEGEAGKGQENILKSQNIFTISTNTPESKQNAGGQSLWSQVQ